MKKFIYGILLTTGVMLSAPVFAQDTATTPSVCTTSQDIQEIVKVPNAAYEFVRSMTADEILVVEKNASAEYNQKVDLDAVDIYQNKADHEQLRIVIFDANGCYKFDFPDTLTHTLKLLEEDHL